MGLRTPFSTLILLSVLFTFVGAQEAMVPRSHDDWWSIQSEHFKLHYPSELEEWSIKTASKMESIHSAVTSFIGYNEIGRPIDVVVMDPLGMPNGMAIPFLKTPGIVLWPNSPVDPFVLGGLETWSEIVVVHEYAHAVHLTRKSRSLQAKIFGRLLPVGPLSMKLPLWATEGYAVLIESKLTGYGRANSSLRASNLSQLAIEGKLPGFDALESPTDWTGYTHPYLIGSAYLEWLMDKSGDPDCLGNLWKRLSARKNRSFKEAFSGVFQNTPENLYARFRAELTAEGLRLEQYMMETGGVEEGSLWHYSEALIDRPAISPDGKEMALVMRSSKKPTQLVVWSTEQEADKKDDPALTDPDDVPDLPMHPPERKELHVFTTRNGIAPSGPRYMPDGQSILFHALRPKPNGDYRSDIYRWHPKTNRLDRLTHGASLAWIDPCHDGLSAVALKQENGFTGIVKLDLATGETQNITEFSLDTVWQQPRISPDSRQIATVCCRDNRTELVILDIDSDNVTVVPSMEREVIFYPAWTPCGGSVVFCSDRSGIINLEMVDLATLQRTQLTRSISGVYAPTNANNSENGLFFLKSHASGTNIHYSVFEKMAPYERPDADFIYTIPPLQVQKPAPFDSFEPLQVKPYKSIENLRYNGITNMAQTPYALGVQLGVRAYDILGRVHVIAMGSMASNGGVKGGMLALGYRGRPVHLKIKGFVEEEQFNRQRLTGNVSPVFPARSARGVDLVLTHAFRGQNWRGSVESGTVWSQYEIDTLDRFDHMSTALKSTVQAFGNVGHNSYSVAGAVTGRIGQTDNDTWARYIWQASAKYGWKYTGLSVSYTKGKIGRNVNLVDQFQLGGTISAIQSEEVHGNRVQAPWYPAGTLLGTQFSKTDLKIILGDNMPFVIYGTEISVAQKTPRLVERVAGCEWRASVPNLSMMRIAPMEFSLGVAYGFKGEIESKWRGYITTKILI